MATNPFFARDYEQPDALGAARGIVFGCVLGGILWAFVGYAIYCWMH